MGGGTWPHPPTKEEDFLVGLGYLFDVTPFEFVLAAESLGIEFGSGLFRAMIPRAGGFDLFIKCVRHTSAFDEAFKDGDFMENYIETILLWSPNGGMKELLARRPGVVLRYYLKSLCGKLTPLGVSHMPYMRFEEIVYFWAARNKDREDFPEGLWMDISAVHSEIQTRSAMTN